MARQTRTIRRRRRRRRPQKLSRRPQKLTFKKAVEQVRKKLNKVKPETLEKACRWALKIALKLKAITKPPPKVIKIPKKSGGFLPLVPLFAGLTALGSLAGGASKIYDSVQATRQAQKDLEENIRHNMAMERKPIGKGVYLQRHQRGLGLFLDK